jgi:hypothetical protein
VDAAQVGRWLGYTVATLFAIISLFRIAKSFKRGITVSHQWEQYWREHEDVRDAIRQAGADENTTEGRQLAQVMSTMPGEPHVIIDFARAAVTSMPTTAHAATLIYTSSDSIQRSSHSNKDVSFRAAGPIAPTAPTPTIGEISERLSDEQHPVLTSSLSSAGPPGAPADEPGLSTHLMELVQKHQVRRASNENMLTTLDCICCGCSNVPWTACTASAPLELEKTAVNWQ